MRVSVGLRENCSVGRQRLAKTDRGNSLSLLSRPQKGANSFEPKGNTMSATRLRLFDEMKSCMKSGQKERLAVIRMLITEVRNAEINDTRQPGRERNEDEVLALLTSYHKALTKSLIDFPEAKHPPIKAELLIVEDFLPKQLSESEIQGFIEKTLSATAERNFGVLMKSIQLELAGKASGQVVSAILKKSLSALSPTL